MALTAQEIKEIILAEAEGSEIRTAFAKGDLDPVVASLLARKGKRGRVPILELKVFAGELGLVGKAAVVTHRPVPEDADGAAFYGLCYTFLWIMENYPDVNVDNVVFQAGLAAFVAVGFLKQSEADAITDLGANREPLAVGVTAEQVEAARRLK